MGGIYFAVKESRAKMGEIIKISKIRDIVEVLVRNVYERKILMNAF